MSPVLEEAFLCTLLFVLLGLALEVGFRSGRRVRKADDGTQVGAVQGAVLGLLGLLLAFSFSGAGSRFLERQDLIVTEANAIGTAFLRADLLDAPHRSELRSALRRYTEHRIAVSATLRRTLDPDVEAEVARLHGRIWRAAVAGVEARPAFTLGVLPPVNEVIDLHATRIAASRKHIPMPVMTLLIACSALAVALIGYGSGRAGQRNAPMTLALVALIGTALWVTIDLDHPRQGMLRLSDAPLRELRLDDRPG